MIIILVINTGSAMELNHPLDGVTFVRVISPVYLFGVKVTPDLECLLAWLRAVTPQNG